MENYQFYPTPGDLAYRLWAKFQDKDFSRVLEPSAGDGALIDAAPSSIWHRRVPIDAIEIDTGRHPALREKSRVVGIDFLSFRAGGVYSHVVMNPPFAEGARHVLHAWDILFDGEIAAIVNAETIRNPFCRERERLVRLIAEHGSVEFVQDAFLAPDSERKTGVEIALVYLRKRARVSDGFGELLDGMTRDETDEQSIHTGGIASELAIPAGFVEVVARAFERAVSAMRDAVIAEARAGHFAARIGQTLAEMSGGAGSGTAGNPDEWVRGEFARRYDDLKDRAWASVLRSTQVQQRLSSGAQQRLEAEFERIKHLEFTAANVYGFLEGLAGSGWSLQVEMACEVFDRIARHHTQNTVFYRGWKSNDKHRTCGISIKMTRFVIPGAKTESWRRSVDYEVERMLSDFDKVFAMLDGKRAPEVALEWVFRHRFDELKRGARVSASYFDVRYYPGVGTIHFFPRSKDLIDRLNRLVGRHRQWLPQEDAQAPAGFWEQHRRADGFDAEVREAFDRLTGDRWWCGLSSLFGYDQEDRQKADAMLDEAISVVLERHGINPDWTLEQQQQPLALPAA